MKVQLAEPIMQPIVKWTGGKRALLPELVRRLPADYRERTHVELFAGGAALFFALQPKRAVLADNCEPLMSMYAAIADEPERVLRSLRALISHHSEQHYYRVRERFNRGLDDNFQTAAAMLYLNRAGYNGLFRCNGKGDFNVPWGARSKAGLYQPELVMAPVPLLRRTRLMYLHFVSATTDLLMGGFNARTAFVYLDPPYIPVCCSSSAQPSFTGYGAGAFGYEDHIKVRDAAAGWAAAGARVMVSNSDTPFVREIWRTWKIHVVKGRRAIGGSRGSARELLIRNYE